MYNSVCDQIVTAFAWEMTLFHNHIRKQCAHKSNREMGSDGADKKQSKLRSTFQLFSMADFCFGSRLGVGCVWVGVVVGGGDRWLCMCMCACVRVHACVCVRVCVYACVCVCVCARMRVCMHVCVCVYAYHVVEAYIVHDELLFCAI